MKTRAEIDPELYILRQVATAARELPGRAGREVETARFNLFQAFEIPNGGLAVRWARALRVAILAVELDPELKRQAFLALDHIDEALV
jgi:hypothetical protein